MRVKDLETKNHGLYIGSYKDFVAYLTLYDGHPVIVQKEKKHIVFDGIDDTLLKYVAEELNLTEEIMRELKELVNFENEDVTSQTLYPYAMIDDENNSLKNGFLKSDYELYLSDPNSYVDEIESFESRGHNVFDI